MKKHVEFSTCFLFGENGIIKLIWCRCKMHFTPTKYIDYIFMKKKVIIPILALMLLISGVGFISHSATYVSNSQKEIIRDSKRLNDLTIFRKAIEEYKTKNGYYPKLETGTNIKGYVNSAWATQWTSFCSLIGLSSCPVDPINTIIGCDCSAFSIDGKCENNNINSNINTATCYNSKDQKFVCTNGSNIYQYQSLNNGRNYSLMMDFEYRKNGDNSAGADYWGVNNNDNSNMISIDNNCMGVVLSNSKPKCGDNIVQFGEQCDGKNKIEFCTNEKGELGKMPIQCIDCVYEAKNTKLTASCNNSAFCGDGVIQIDKNEECDGGYEKMCFNSTNSTLGKHDWYNEQLRYCQSNCKWSNTNDYKNSLTKDICGGYCGDGKIQGSEDCDYNVEYYFWDNDVKAFKRCSDYNLKDSCPISNCEWSSDNVCVKKESLKATSNEKHCYIRSGSPCKYINNSPVVPTIKNSNFTALSYIKDANNYTESVSSINETTLAIKKTSRNSVYLEFSLGGIVASDDNISDIDGDEIMYKFEFVDKANTNVGFYKTNYDIGDKTIKSSSRGTEITGKWIKHSELAKIDPSDGKYTDRVYFRIYSTSLSENLEEANNDIVHLLDGTYFGDYKFKISIKDSWSNGANVDGNRQGVESSKEISFYIGSSCGDHVLQAINDEGQHEYCETKSGFDKFSNWSVNEPSGNGNCAVIKVGPGWNGKWDDVPCDNSSFYNYGICKKQMNKACPDGWISIKESGENYSCYRLTDAKTSYDKANSECIYDHDAELVNIQNPAENNLIKELIEGTSSYGKFTYSGSPFFWIGFYNVQKLRTDAQNSVFYDSNGKLLPDINKYSLWVPSKENGDPNVYSSSMYNGGSGKNFSSQYLCSGTCNDIGGFCGDGILENGTQLASNSSFYTVQTNSDKSTIKNFYLGNFEQCDPTSQGKSDSYKGQTGLGTGWYLQADGTKIGDNYGCNACSLVGGYCGSGAIDSDNFKDGNHNNNSNIDELGIDYEHCDSKYVLSPKESKNNNGGLTGRGSMPNYICTSNSDNISSADTSSNIYKIANPKTENKMTWFAYNSENKSSNKLILKQFIAEPFKGKSYDVNPNGACQNSTGGFCGDGKIQMAYIGYKLTQQVDESYSSADYYKDTYSNTDLLYNDKDIELGRSLQKVRKIIVGTSNYRNNNTNSSVITSANKGSFSNVLTRNYNYGINNNNTYVADINNVGKFDNLSGIAKTYWLEKCDPAYFPKPYETNNLASGSYYQKVDSDLNYIADVNFDGYPTLRYECEGSGDRACDFKTYKINTSDTTGNGDIIAKDTNNIVGIGYCGDGVITGYGSDDSIQKVNNPTRELCDPKNHIVGPNGSDSAFGDNAIYGCKRNTQYNYFNSDFVFGKDCSSYITPATSNGVDRQYECKYDCTSGGGYCGDGIIQDSFFEECDPGNAIYNGTNGVLKNFSSATMNANYLCGVQNGYDSYSFDLEYQTNDDLKTNFDSTSFRDDSKSNNGKVASCKSFGGYCGDGAVQVCSSGNNFYGGNKNYNNCYNLQKDSDGEYSFISNGSTQIETCDSNDSGCFVVDANSNAIRPALQSQNIDIYNFASASSDSKTFYSELSAYTVKGAGSSIASSYPGISGVCGTSNPASVSSTHQITDLCNVGTASTPVFNTTSKSFEWNCSGIKGGRMASCSVEAQFENIPRPGICGASNAFVCGEPVCKDSDKVVYEGSQCTAGSDCEKICRSTAGCTFNNVSVGMNEKCNDGAGCFGICTAQCTYKGDKVASGEPCDEGRTCSTTIKQSFSSIKEIKDKCNSGFGMDINYDDGKWTWTCEGINGSNSDSNCFATANLSINGSCSSGFGLCTVGIADKPKFNASKNRWEWKCAGFNGGGFGDCTSGAYGTEKNIPSCGSANGGNFVSLYSLMNDNFIYSPRKLCNSGVPSVVNLNSGKKEYTWKCTSNGNDAANCSATLNTDAAGVNGVCNAPSSTTILPSTPCSSGYPSNVIYIPAFNKLKWDCKGVGVNASAPVKDDKCSSIVPGVSISGECGSPFAMFGASSGVQYPSSSNEAQEAVDNGKLFFGMQFKMCESGYATKLSQSNANALGGGGKSWADLIMQFGETKYNQCDYTGNKYVSSDCINLKLKIPFIGTLQIFHMTMPWQWTCNGIGSGASKQCFVFNPSMLFKKNGSCGNDANKTWADVSLIMNRCKVGYASNITINTSNKLEWKCTGFNGGSESTCTANYKATGAVDGYCGTSQARTDLWSYSNVTSPCINGVFKDLAVTQDSKTKSIKLEWVCKGLNGGKTVNCASGELKDTSSNLLTVLNGKCKSVVSGTFKSTSDISFANGCEYGLIRNIRYDNGKFKWNCAGSADGNVDQCETNSFNFGL